MIGYVYLTTNMINNKRYIGQHRSIEFDPSYLGSGKLLTRAIQKYTKEAFKCEILCTCESDEELDHMERYYISKYNAVNSPEFYNLSEGGYSGDKLSDSIYTKNAWKDPEYRKKHVDAMKAKWADPDHHASHSKANRDANHISAWTDEAREIHRRKQKDIWRDPVLKAYHKQRMSEALSLERRETRIGKNNPSYGKHYYTDGEDNWIFCAEHEIPDGWYLAQFYWINNGIKNKRIEITHEVPDGWVKGRLSVKDLQDT